jgi:arsenic resistance protein ArsH
MRMFTIPNQASLPKAWTAFDEEGRMLRSSNRDRLVDVCEELVKTSVLFFDKDKLFADRWSERVEREEHGRLRTQDEKEKEKALQSSTTSSAV